MTDWKCLVEHRVKSEVFHTTLDWKIFSLVIIEGEPFSSGDSVYLSW